MGQRLQTESGVALGVCRDAQFDTKLFRLEWLFPRLFLRWGVAVPASAIVEVRTDAVMVRDSVLGAVTDSGAPVFKALDDLTKAPTPSAMSSEEC